jgi:hypothetical protein
MSTPSDDIEQTEADTAKLLGLSLDDMSYITPELLAQPARDFADLDDGELPPHEEHEAAPGLGFAGVVPNRVMFISEMQPGFVPGGLSNYVRCEL